MIAEGKTSFTWTNVAEGKHTVCAVGYDSNNKEYSTAKIPGKIEAEDLTLAARAMLTTTTARKTATRETATIVHPRPLQQFPSPISVLPIVLLPSTYYQSRKRQSRTVG